MPIFQNLSRSNLQALLRQSHQRSNYSHIICNGIGRKHPCMLMEYDRSLASVDVLGGLCLGRLRQGAVVYSDQVAKPLCSFLFASTTSTSPLIHIWLTEHQQPGSCFFRFFTFPCQVRSIEGEYCDRAKIGVSPFESSFSVF